MKNNVFSKYLGLVFLFAILATFAQAQNAKIDNWTPNNQDGVNVFEAPKQVDGTFDGLKVRIGGAFAQQYQSLSHSNNATVKEGTYQGKTINLNELYDIAPGFNLASANMYVDVQLEDGIRLAVESYMSARHHQEFWVKGGYIQVDKLPMFGNPDWFSKYMRVKVGHFQVNYGDQQFRRTDNGMAMRNPFVGNYIMDAFATEIGGEAYLFLPSGIMGMVGITNGQIKGDIAQSDRRAPSIYAKLAYDSEINADLRFRLSGSVYSNAGGVRNTLYGGDRAGSRFYLAMEPAYFTPRGASSPSAANPTDLAFSGRINPNFTTKVMSWQINPFVKYQGLEVLGTLEQSSGYAQFGSEAPPTRKVTQVAVEGIYRFLKNEQLFIGARYNNVSGEILSPNNDVSVNRFEMAAGWYPVKSLLLKGSYVNQKYVDFPSSDIRSEGEFHGIMIEAVVGF
jgi:hypothetical protein